MWQLCGDGPESGLRWGQERSHTHKRVQRVLRRMERAATQRTPIDRPARRRKTSAPAEKMSHLAVRLSRMKTSEGQMQFPGDITVARLWPTCPCMCCTGCVLVENGLWQWLFDRRGFASVTRSRTQEHFVWLRFPPDRLMTRLAKWELVEYYPCLS